MPHLTFIISDMALANAIGEQWQATHPGGWQRGTDLFAAYQDAACVGLVVDAADIDKTTLKLLPPTREELEKPVICLGPSPADSELVLSEIFSKPFRLGHLLAQLHYHLEIVPRLRSRAIEWGLFRLEPQNRQLIVKSTGAAVRLTEKETALLTFLYENERPVSREELLAAVWGYDAQIDTRTLETHIYQLRRKLDPGQNGERFVINEQGLYRLER